MIERCFESVTLTEAALWNRWNVGVMRCSRAGEDFRQMQRLDGQAVAFEVSLNLH